MNCICIHIDHCSFANIGNYLYNTVQFCFDMFLWEGYFDFTQWPISVNWQLQPFSRYCTCQIACYCKPSCANGNQNAIPLLRKFDPTIQWENDPMDDVIIFFKSIDIIALWLNIMTILDINCIYLVPTKRFINDTFNHLEI